MKKMFVIMAAALFLLITVSPDTARAAVYDTGTDESLIASEYSFDELIEEQYRASGAENIYGALPDDVRYSLKRAGIDLKSGINGDDPDHEALLRELADSMTDAASAPLKTCCALLGIIMISAMISALTEQQGGAASGTMGTVVGIACCAAAAVPAAEHISRCAEVLTGLCVFAQAAIPVMCALMIAARGGVSGGGAALMSCASGVLGMAADGGLLELLRIYLALSCVSAVSGVLRLDGLLAVIEKNIKWALTFTATVFLGLLAVSGASASAFDQVRMKAFKLIVSGSVPIIGGAVGDALGSLRSCVLILKTSVGSFGILAAGFILIPPIIKTLLWRLAMELCSAAAGMFGVKPAEKLLGCCAGAMNILLSLLVFCGVILLGSLACAMGGGTV